MRSRNDEGLGLIEVLVAMGIFVVAIVGTATMIVYAMRLQSQSTTLTNTRAVATRQIEELRVLHIDNPQRQVGGDLNANVANYFNTATAGFLIRWQIVVGPAGTKDITVRVIPTNPRFQPVEVRGMLWP
jgi:Tfp pilus assembly protein PilV